MRRIAMGYYPAFIDLSERPCVVIGGGPVAERKVEGLLAAGAAVTVISPALTARLEALAGEGRVRDLRREYATGDLAGYRSCFTPSSSRWSSTGPASLRAKVLLPGLWALASRARRRVF